MAVAQPAKRKFKFPTAFTILILLTVVVAILTFVTPAGQYDYNENGEPIPGTYHTVAPIPQRLKDAIMAPINGMYGIWWRFVWPLILLLAALSIPVLGVGTLV